MEDGTGVGVGEGLWYFSYNPGPPFSLALLLPWSFGTGVAVVPIFLPDHAHKL